MAPIDKLFKDSQKTSVIMYKRKIKRIYKNNKQKNLTK